MAISRHIARLREFVGPELLVLPAVSALLTDHSGRLLLVRPAGGSSWAILGGAVDPGESPRQAVAREAREEIGVEIGSLRLLDVVGGSEYEVTYPNGDQVAYVCAVFAGIIVAGEPVADGEEVTQFGWFAAADLPAVELNTFAQALLTATGWLAPPDSA